MVFDSLGIEWEQSRPDLGIRLEAQRNLFTSEYTYQVDPKYKFAHFPYGTSRTFCGCHGGMIVPVKFGDSFYADGAFGESFTNSSNLAFMVRAQNPISTDDLEQWCRSINIAAKGSLLLGEVSLRPTKPPELVAEIMKLVPHWPTEEHRIMLSELLLSTLGDPVKLLESTESGNSPVKVYGPAVDLYWPRPRFEKGLETNVAGVFVLGDITGVSRGFVQAMISGAAWAMHHLAEPSRPNRSDSTRKEVEQWFALA
jgi:uncharacterized FAD-dependent dehydrogenase